MYRIAICDDDLVLTKTILNENCRDNKKTSIRKYCYLYYSLYRICYWCFSIFRLSFCSKRFNRPSICYRFKSCNRIYYIAWNFFFNLYNSKQLTRISYKHIYYIYKDAKNSIFILSYGQEKERKSLTDIYKELNPTEFIFIERGYIVNINHITNIKGHILTLENGTQLPISHSHLLNVRNAFLYNWDNT